MAGALSCTLLKAPFFNFYPTVYGSIKKLGTTAQNNFFFNLDAFDLIFERLKNNENN